MLEEVGLSLNLLKIFVQHGATFIIKLTMEWMLATNDCTSSYSFALYPPHHWEIPNFASFPSKTLSNLNMSHPEKYKNLVIS